MDILGTARNPIHVRWMDDKSKVLSAVISVGTITVVMLMQNPAMRQALKMRASYYGMKFCAGQVAYWKRMETIAHHSYDVARL